MKNSAFKLAAVALAAASAFASGAAGAAGFQLTEQTALALGRAYAGVGVDGKDISGTYYNPATMVLHKGTNIQMGFVHVGLNLDYKDNESSAYDENGRKKSQTIPFGYITHEINDKVWIGLAMTVPFGMGTDYSTSWARSEKGVSATILTYDFNPNVAFKLSDRFSFGAGFSIQYAKADLKQGGSYSYYGYNLPITSEIDADSTAWGWNVGVMWAPAKSLRFGLSYRSEVNHHADGDLNIYSQYLQGLLGSSDLKMDGSAFIAAPQWAMATAAWDVNSFMSLYATVRWCDWSSFESLTIDGTGSVLGSVSSTITNKWKDTYLFSLGSDFNVSDKWTLRCGVAYETSPIGNKVHRLAVIPDTDRWWFALGASYKYSDTMSFDIGGAHLHGVHERGLWSDSGEEYGKFRKLDAYLLGAQVQFHF